tara:strand:+ start:2194 stop:2358 length:165 start_codon:yes stop_codon:yes gene_type:complete
MEDIIYKSTIGTGGFIATLELSPVNEVLGFCVGLATFLYMAASAIKVIKELRKK